MSEAQRLIEKRWSPVAFDPKPVSEEEVTKLFEAARWAPSARNAQPWRFIVAHKGSYDYYNMMELMDEGNQVWAQTAPLLVLALAQVVSTYKNRPNRLAMYETGMAVAHLLFRATDMGLMVHQMAGYREEEAKEVLVIPSRYEPTAMMAIGYKGDPSQLPPEVAKREEKKRTRMALDKFVVEGKCK